jgi:hypothetical protein
MGIPVRVTRILTFAGLVLTAVGGYVLGRRGVDVRVAVNRALQLDTPDTQTTEIALRVTRPSYDTEFDHVADREHDERHRIAEEIKGHPLQERRERDRHRQDEDEFTTATSQPLTRDREDIVAPRPY